MAELVVKLVNGELAGKTAQSIAKEYTAAAQAVKKAEVGTQAWIDAHAKLENVKKLQGDVKKQIESTTAASDMLKGAWNKLPGAQFFNQIGDSIGMAKQGVGGMVSSFGVLKTAIAATGLGLLVIVLTQIYTWFSKTDEGATKLDGIFRAIGNTVDVIASKFIHWKDTLYEIATGQFLSKLWTDVKEGIDLGQELAQTFDDLDDKRRAMELADQQQTNNLDQLMLQSKNVGLSYKERIALLDQADKIELENYAKKLKYAQDYAAAVQKETDFQKKNGTISDEQLDKQNEANIKLLQVENERIKVEEKIANRREQLMDKEDRAREKSAEENRKRLEKQQKDEDDRLKKLADSYAKYEDQKIALMKDGQDKELAQIELGLARQLEEIFASGNLVAERVTAAQELAEQAKDAVIAKYQKKQKDDAVKAEMEKQELVYTTETNQLQEQFLAKQITAEQYANITAQKTLDYESRRLDIIKAAHGEESAEYQKAYGDLLEHQQKFSDESAKATEALAKSSSKSIADSMGVVAGFLGSIAGLYEQGTAQYKAFAIAQAVISTIQSGINAYMSAAAIPVYGQVLGPLAAAAAVASGYAQVRKIEGTKVPTPVKAAQPTTKRELGGPLYGPLHSQGGIPLYEAEGGEFVFSRKAVSAIGVRELSRINDFYTRKLASGGPVDPYSTTAQSASRSSANGGGLNTGMEQKLDQVVQELQMVRSTVMTWPSRLKAYVVAREVKDQIDVEAKLRDDASF
jgi:hypothetical protein